MTTFRTTLVPGSKAPYHRWTFVVIPAALSAAWGSGPHAVRGTISGTAFRGTASRGEGLLRVPVPRAVREQAGVANGDSVEVTIALDSEPRPVEVPDELRAVFASDPHLEGLYQRLPPAHRRAWASYIGDAKRPETRLRRAGKAAEGIRARTFPR